MTDEELEDLIRDVEKGRARRELPELDEPLGPEVARSIVERFSDAPAQAPALPEPANRPWTRVVAAVVVLAAAALIVVAVWPGQAPVPSYTLEARTGISEVRSEQQGPLVHADGAPVRLLLRPATRTARVPEVRVYSGAEQVPASVRVEASGALTVQLGTLPAGTHDVRVELWTDGDAPAQQLEVRVQAR